MLNLFVANLGKYNEGDLIGEWLRLPATAEEISDCLTRIGISNEPDEYGIYYDEYFFPDYECEDLPHLKLECGSIVHGKPCVP